MLNLNTNTNTNNVDLTKSIFFYSLFSIILIIIFMITPLNNVFLLSPIMKIIIIIILGYTFYLNIKQIGILRNKQPNQNDNSDNSEFTSQLNTNIWTSYIFCVFITLFYISCVNPFGYCSCLAFFLSMISQLIFCLSVAFITFIQYW